MTTDLVEKCAIAASLADNYANDGLFAENYRNIALAVIDALADGIEAMGKEIADGPDTPLDKALLQLITYRGTGPLHGYDLFAAAIRAAKSREGA